MAKDERFSHEEKHALLSRNWPDLAKKGPHVVGRLWGAADRVRNVVASKILRHGIQVADFQVLFILRIHGPPYALSPTNIYRTQCCSSGGMTKILHRLQKARLIKRYTNPDDKRSKLVCLTSKGKRVTEVTVGNVAQLEELLLSHFTKREKKTLTTLLDKLLAKI